MKYVSHTLTRLVMCCAFTGFAILNANADVSGARRALNDATAGRVDVSQNPNGFVAHLRATSAPIPIAKSGSAEQRARRFLSDYRDLFLNASTPLEFATRVAPSTIPGTSLVRVQQAYKSIPVRGGEAIVHLDSRGVTAVQSKLLPDLAAVDTVPALSSAQARGVAEREMARLFPRVAVSYTEPALEIVNVGVLLQKSDSVIPSRLAWFTEMRGQDVREFVWVDAKNGQLLLHFSQMAHAAGGAVAVEDAIGSCLAALPIDAPYYDSTTSIPAGSEVEYAYINATAAYDFFATTYGLAGFKASASPTAISIVNVCDSDFPQPIVMEKAQWDGVQMFFATGMAAADDVVGHEFTHGVIEYSSQLNLVQQSGALAEGFSDVLGEAIDQLQKTDNDTGDTNWAFGEDASGGPFRNLMTPQDFNLPNKVTDSKFYCGADTQIWIHSNGAVLGHAFALLSDGGSFNGFNITGIGINKASRIFYEVMTASLSTATFSDAYEKFKVVADQLLASSIITTSDRAQLIKALDAVELGMPPCSSTLNYCPTGQTAVVSFSDDFTNTNSGNWVNSILDATYGINHWNGGTGTPDIYYSVDMTRGLDPATATVVGIYPFNGTNALWADSARGSYAARIGDSVVAMASSVNLPASGILRMQFEGRYFFEQITTTDPTTGLPIGPDGGIIEYSIDGGTTWKNVETQSGSLISAGQGYNGIIQADQSNPLGGEHGFVGSIANGNYASTQLDLISLAGQAVRFRFRVGTDNFGTNGLGWQVDNVVIYSCSNAALTVSPATGLSTSESGGTANFTVKLASAPTASVVVKVESSNTAEGTVSPAELFFEPTNFDLEQIVTVTGVDDSTRDGSQSYTVTVSVGTTTDPGFQNTPPIDVALTNTDNENKKGGGGADALLLLILLFALLLSGMIARRRPLT